MKQEIKLIVTDLDGTFLNEDKKVSAANKQAIASCRQKRDAVCNSKRQTFGTCLRTYERMGN